jgi:hypothetical protein
MFLYVPTCSSYVPQYGAAYLLEVALHIYWKWRFCVLISIAFEMRESDAGAARGRYGVRRPPPAHGYRATEG